MSATRITRRAYEHPRRAARPYSPTYHRDGSVTYWDVYCQQWIRSAADRISDQTMATQDEQFRRWVLRRRDA